MTGVVNEDRFDNIDTQLERISTALIKGSDRIDKTLEAKADTADIQKVFNLLDSLFTSITRSPT